MAVERGETVVLPCNATGIPTPVFSWSKDGDEAENGRRNAIQMEGLRVERARSGDSGDYVCTANNSAGIANTTVTLNVHCKERIFARTYC